MKTYIFADFDNEEVGYIIRLPKKLLIYFRWSSPWAYKLKFGKFTRIDYYTDKEELEELEDEIDEILDEAAWETDKSEINKALFEKLG